MKDFHSERLTQPVHPTVISFQPGRFSFLGVKVKPDRMDDTLAFLKEVWMQFLPERPFDYKFLDDRINALYLREERTARLMGDFSAIGILLGCMGLFGWASFTVVHRRKEIGIRKTLGASVWGLVYKLSRESGSVVLLANVVAWPVGLFLMQRWLNQFAYRIDLHVGFFVMAGCLALIIALMTVGYQTTRAAQANPVDVLRDE